MEVTRLSLEGLLKIKPEIHIDERGFMMDTYHREKYMAHGIVSEFVQDAQSHSTHGVIRGLKFQYDSPTDKLIRVVYGNIFAVAVDIRPDSSTFGQWEALELSLANNTQLFIPFGFAFGFCALSETAGVLYKLSAFHNASGGATIRWSDSDIGIIWPVQEPLVAKADSEAPLLKEWSVSPVAQLFAEAHKQGVKK